VREVHEALSRTKDTAYTTVLKMMTIMADKGLLGRDESERSHRYTSLHPEPLVQASLLRDLMHRAFGGSALQLVQRAIDEEGATTEELDAIALMIAKAKQAKGPRP
jgi:predicted transcriptional regulator